MTELEYINDGRVSEDEEFHDQKSVRNLTFGKKSTWLSVWFAFYMSKIEILFCIFSSYYLQIFEGKWDRYEFLYIPCFSIVIWFACVTFYRSSNILLGGYETSSTITKGIKTIKSMLNSGMKKTTSTIKGIVRKK